MLGGSVEYRRGVQNGVPAKSLRLSAESENGSTGKDQSSGHRTVSSGPVPKGCPPRGSEGRSHTLLDGPKLRPRNVAFRTHGFPPGVNFIERHTPPSACFPGGYFRVR
jgi:hypothetical protein